MAVLFRKPARAMYVLVYCFFVNHSQNHQLYVVVLEFFVFISQKNISTKILDTNTRIHDHLIAWIHFWGLKLLPALDPGLNVIS